MSKFIIILIALTSVQSFSRDVLGQDKNHLNIERVSLKTALKEIEKTWDYHFLYNDNLINAAGKVFSLKPANSSIDSLLDALLSNTNLTWHHYPNNVVIIGEKGAEKDPVKITGTITDEKNQPLPGVSITIKGSTAGTSTDDKGKFSLTIPSENTNAVLVISSVGFITQEVSLSGKTNLALSLREDVKSLNEVVIVGYNAVKKKDVTGSVVSVSAEEIRSRPVTTALEAMQGKAAGVDITSTDRPGQLGTVLIRGQRSLTASSSPLYVVDGVPLATGGIEAINPNDIQTIDILKDASATAIYGSRGANGVIIITTKRGTNGSLSINYTGTMRIDQLVDRTHMMNAAQYIDFRRDAYRRINYLDSANGVAVPANTGYPTVPTLVDDQRIFGQDPYAYANVLKGWQNGTFNGNLVPTTNWTGMVEQTAITQDHTLSVSGGSAKIKSYASFGYLNQQGTQLGQSYERYTGKVSVDITPTKWFAMGANINITSSTQQYGFSSTSATGPGSIYAAAQGMLPYAVPFDSTGKRINLPGGDIGILNVIGEDKYNINQRKVLRALGSVYGEITFMKGLKYRVQFGPDYYDLQNGRFMSANSINRGGGQPGSTNFAELSQDNKFAYTLDNLVYYNKTINKHDFGITLLQSASLNRDEPSDMSAVNVPFESQLWYQLNSVSALNSFSTNLTKSTLTSYMARGNYSYMGKYLLTASARWDGASQLAPGHKWDFFPSLALAWRVKQEDFMKHVNWLDDLKLRLGVGSTGNAAVTPYTTEGRLQTLYYTFGPSVVPGYVSSDASLATPISFPNPSLGWEHTTQYNLGIDFNIFKGRLGGTIDMYTTRTTNLLLLRTIPSINGYTTSLDNIGISANRGIDITLNSVNVRNASFTWSTTFNFAANKDRIVELENGKNDDVNNLWFIGQRLSVGYDYKKIGIWQNTPADLAEMAKFNANIASKTSWFRPGSIKVADLNHDYKIDANNDRTIVGHYAPSWVGGITNEFDYKAFSLSIFIYSRWGFTMQTGQEPLQGRYAQRQLNYWTPTNPTNDYPAPNYNSATGDAYVTSENYRNGSFIAIRNISLGYSLPDAVSKKMSLSRVRIYGQVINPTLIYSKIGWLNPDTGTSTYNRGFVVGLNVGL